MKFLDKLKSINPYEQIRKLALKIKVMMPGMLRPYSTDRLYSYNGFIVPKYIWPLHSVYEIAYNSDVLSTVQHALKREIFRNGIEVMNADQSDEDMSTGERGKVTDKEISKTQKAMSNVNDNNQSLEDVQKEIEDDLNIIDDAYMMFLFDYTFNAAGEISDFDLNETIRVDPKGMSLVMNRQERPGYDDNDNLLTVCGDIAHRNKLLRNDTTCPDCGKKTYKAFFRHGFGGYHAKGHELYYLENEVVHLSKYRPSKSFGFSPVMTVWLKVFTLNAQDEYLKDTYSGQRSPNQMMIFNTSNYETLSKAWEDMKERVELDPGFPAMLAIENMAGPNGPKKVAEMFDFMRTLPEMQYTESRNEMRQQIGATFGVLPIWQGDVSTGGGLNNEGMQVTVTNRAVEVGQKVQDKFLEKWLEAKKITGQVARLRPSEEQDEMAKLQRTEQSLRNGRMAVELGLEAEFDSNTGEVKIKEGTLELQDTDGFAGTPFDSSSPPPTGSGSSGKPAKPLQTVKFVTKELVEKARKRPAFTKFADIIKEEIESFTRRYKRNPTEREVKNITEDIKKKLVKNLKDSTDNFLTKTYMNGVSQVEKDLDVNIQISKRDLNALEVLKNQKVLNQAYKGLSITVAKEINDIFKDAFKKKGGLNLTEIEEKIKEVSDVADFRAETIARTETNKVASAARRVSYSKEDPDNELKFKHIGPNDRRTTNTSKRIKERTSKGVSWDKYVQIVKEESAKDFPDWTVNKDFPVAFYNTRHTFVRTQ